MEDGQLKRKTQVDKKAADLHSFRPSCVPVDAGKEAAMLLAGRKWTDNAELGVRWKEGQ